jgi:hypothetical protein
MMTGTGPFGPLEMGGMFTSVKVRAGLARDDYADPGPYAQPPGTRAFEWTGAPLAALRAPAPDTGGRAAPFEVRKPTDHSGH